MQIQLKCVNDITPVFSWLVKAAQGKMQKSYRLVVKACDGNVMWDSGTVLSDASTFIKYAGQPLAENTNLGVISALIPGKPKVKGAIGVSCSKAPVIEMPPDKL